jgi:transketolase
VGTAVIPAEWKDTPEHKAITAIRTLAMDGVQQANSGHPGTPVAMAPVVYTLWNRFLRFDPQAPIWPNRDRFVQSMGHASMLLYSILHLTGTKAVNPKYETTGEPTVKLEDMKSFRQLKSKCAGHPEYRWTSGVETTTGPLGNGLATSVGMAIGGKWLAANYNKDGFPLFDFNVYSLGGDGCFMEGISAEAASLAGHLKLNNLCWIYDNNHITIEGNTSLAFSEDVAVRFLAYGWNVTRVADANDIDMLTRAFQTARATSDRPTLIVVDSHIAWGVPGKQDTSHAHGEPLGWKAICQAKQFYGCPIKDGTPPADNTDKDDPRWKVGMFENCLFDGVYEHYQQGIGKRGKELHDAWIKLFAGYKAKYPKEAREIEQMQRRELPEGWDKNLPVYPSGEVEDKKTGKKSIAATAGRDVSGQVLNVLAQNVPWLMGGSADLAPSTKTRLNFKEAGDFLPNDYKGRNFHFGIREHAMGAIMNGMALCKVRAYGSGFLIFSDFGRNPIRLASIMEIPVIYIFTHDSIGVGEDGPTHQPIEQVASLRAIPGLQVWRPGDANECVEAWKEIMKLQHVPACLILTREPLTTVDRKKYTPASETAKGAYILADAPGGKPDVIILASGSSLPICMEGYEQLTKEGVKARVVSMPCWERFEYYCAKEKDGEAYREKVLPSGVRARVAVELASSFGWHKYIGLDGSVITMSGFGESAPLKVLAKHFGFTTEKVVAVAKEQLAKNKK